LAIERVVNFCKKIGAKLYFGGMIVDVNDIGYISKYKNYIQFYGLWGLNRQKIFYDVGKDNLHPGPETHKIYAEKFLEQINNA
jgi:hypothetical protein